MINLLNSLRRHLGAVACATLLAAALAPSVAAAKSAQRPEWSIAIHGGAGVIERAQMTPEREAAFRASLDSALAAGRTVLERGGAALDAVEAAVQVMEDDPLFNAGRGAVFTAEGRVELDASVMDGRTRAAGAVAGVTRVKNPIRLARAVMERSPHVLLSGEGAETFARAQSLELVEPSYFHTVARWRQLEAALAARGEPAPARPAGLKDQGASAPAPLLDERKFGTVGVVAIDRAGDLAAGTSTGGTTAKRWGRIGDSPVIGAGTYAQNGVCAVSATGAGEYFIRVGVARAICARMELRGETAQAAADHVIQRDLAAIGGDGGVIVMGPRGEAAFSFNTSGMYRARQRAGGAPEIAIFAGEARNSR